jgi:hypothetical protein
LVDEPFWTPGLNWPWVGLKKSWHSPIFKWFVLKLFRPAHVIAKFWFTAYKFIRIYIFILKTLICDTKYILINQYIMTFRGTVSPNYICLEVVRWIGLVKSMRHWISLHFYTFISLFIWPLMFFSSPFSKCWPNHLFTAWWLGLTLAPLQLTLSCTTVSSVCPSTVSEVALDSKVLQVVQQHTYFIMSTLADFSCSYCSAASIKLAAI